MDGLTPEDIAREIRAQLDASELEIGGERIEGMWDGDAFDALKGLADRFAALFMQRNPAFSAVQFERECGFGEVKP